MTERTLGVLLEGSRAGDVTQDRHGRFRFDYDEDWRLAGRSTPLSLSMPLTIRSHPNDVIEPFMWNLLPDSDKVIKRWAREHQASPRNPFGLLTHVGEDCAGAVQFVVPERAGAAARAGDVDWLEVDEVASIIGRLRRDPTAWQVKLHHGRFSLAGAQAKVALLYDDARWGLPSGRTPTTHILKPAIAGLDDHDLNEHLCLLAARLAGLRAARTQVVSFGDERAIVVERYDRVKRGDEWLRVHQEDMCQALGVGPDKKYQADGGPSPLQIANVLRRSDPRGSSDSVSAFFDALVFNWLIAGTDAHAKNYSVLLSGRQVRLAPLYDVASALPYETIDLRDEKMAMSVDGEYRFDWIAVRHWARLAQKLRLPADAALARMADLARRVPDCFAQAAADDAVAALESPLPALLTAAVADRASSCLALLRGASV